MSFLNGIELGHGLKKRLRATQKWFNIVALSIRRESNCEYKLTVHKIFFYIKGITIHLFPAISTSSTVLVSPGSNLTAVPAAIFYQHKPRREYTVNIILSNPPLVKCLLNKVWCRSYLEVYSSSFEIESFPWSQNAGFVIFSDFKIP